jgi:hypothetical protein
MNFVVFILLLTALFGALIFLASNIQSFFIGKAYDGIKYQEVAQFYLVKNIFLLIVLLEAPLILISISLGMMGSLFIQYYDDPFLASFAIPALIGLFLITLMTVYVHKGPAQSLLYACSNHPQLGNVYTNNSLFLFSLIQTPLIFCLVIFFMAFLKVNNIINSLASLEYIGFINGSSVLNVAIAGLFVTSAIGNYITEITKAGSIFPNRFIEYVKQGILSLALIEAPLVFTVLINILIILKVGYDSLISILIVFFLGLIFSFSAGFLSKHSSRIASSGIKSSMVESVDIKKIHRMVFISQVFLDARLLYIFIIVILIFQYMV